MMPRQMQDVRYTIVFPRENIKPPKQTPDVRYSIVFPRENIKPPKQVTTKAADQQNLLMMEPRETAGGQIMMPRQRQDAEYTIILPREKNIKTPKQVANKAQIQETKQLSAVTSVIVGQNHDDERKSRRISLPRIEVSQEIGKKTLNIADQILNVNTTEQTPRTAAILRQDVVPVNRVNNVTITTPIESVITRQDIVPINRLYNINRTLTIPRTPRPPRIPIPRRRRRTDRTDDPFGGYRKIKPQNLDHASILDPLQAINPKTKSYMTNTRTPKARGTLYEFNGIISPTPPAWATESPKNKPTKKTKTKNKPSKRKQTTHRHTQKTNKPTQKRR